MGVSNIVYFHSYLGKIPILTNMFQMGWNHQPVLKLSEVKDEIEKLGILSFFRDVET